MRFIWLGAFLVVVVVAIVLLRGGGDSGDKPRRTTIAVARGSGPRAKAAAEGIAHRPVAVAVRTSAAPKQHVTVVWGLSCPKTDKGTSKGTGGTYVATPPDVRPLELPRRDIAFCAVRAEATLSRSGRLKVTLLASHG
jgi:hypothetical protein